MRCPRCQSENVSVQVKNTKNPMLTVGLIVFCVGMTLMLSIIGLVISLIVVIVLKSSLPTPTETIAVCQNCALNFTPSAEHCVEDELRTIPSNNTELLVIRGKNSCGSAVVLRVRVNDSQPKGLYDGQTCSFEVSPGSNTLYYEQLQGSRKKKRTGVMQLNIPENTRYSICITFTPNGLDIVQV